MAESPGVKEKSYVCAICPGTHFKNLKEYRIHSRNHEENDFVESVINKEPRKIKSPKNNPSLPAVLHECPNCPQKFHKSASYRRHLLSHLDLKPYFCKDCFEGFMKKQDLVSHRKKCHKGIKYTCSVCTKQFSHRHALLAHKTEHINGPPFKCIQCPAVFPTNEKRTRHLTYHSTPCPICLKPFNTYERLYKHLGAKHPDSDDCNFLDPESSHESSDSDFAEIESDSDPYTSDDSSKGSASSSQKVITKVPHVCFICERRFRKEMSLKIHMNTHRVFFCNNCPKFFPSSSLLRAHVIEHNLSTQTQNSTPQLSPQPAILFMNTAVPGKSDERVENFSHTGSNVVQQERNSDAVANSASLNYNCVLPSNFAPIDILSWHSNFKNKIGTLEYPLPEGEEIFVKQMIYDLASNIHTIPPVQRENYANIFKDLSNIIEKNDSVFLKRK